MKNPRFFEAKIGVCAEFYLEKGEIMGFFAIFGEILSLISRFLLVRDPKEAYFWSFSSNVSNFSRFSRKLWGFSSFLAIFLEFVMRNS